MLCIHAHRFSAAAIQLALVLVGDVGADVGIAESGDHRSAQKQCWASYESASNADFGHTIDSPFGYVAVTPPEED